MGTNRGAGHATTGVGLRKGKFRAPMESMTLRRAEPDEIAAACVALESEHYLDAPQHPERVVMQLAVRGQHVLAVLRGRVRR